MSICGSFHTIRAVIKLLIGIMIFVGLPLLGWGMNDLRDFMIDPVKLGYVFIVVLLQIIIVIKLPEVGSDRGKENKIVRRQRLAVLLLLSLAIVIAAPYCDRRNIAVLGETDIVRYFKLVLFALGFVGTVWAEASLGKQFSVQIAIQDSHRLVMDGLYRYLRHPRYLGIMLFSIGISLVFRSLLALILVAALILVLIWRIHDEEALMHQEFGTDWETYSQRSWRLILFVY